MAIVSITNIQRFLRQKCLEVNYFHRWCTFTQYLTHIALIDLAERNYWLNEGDHQFRSLFALVQYFHASGVTRKDFAEDNAATKTAIEKLGKIPSEILDGTKRSRFSPPLRTEDEPLPDEDSEGIDEDFSSIMVVLPDESESDPSDEYKDDDVPDDTPEGSDEPES